MAVAQVARSTSSYPADVTFQEGPLNRNRLSVLLRSIYAIPAAVVVEIYGIGFLFTTFFAWWAILFTGRYPDGMFNFGVNYMRMTANLYAYELFVTDEYPPWTGDSEKAASYPVQYSQVYSGSSNRLTVFFRHLLAFPAYIFAIVPLLVLVFVGLAAWVMILITGEYPEGMLRMVQGSIRSLMRITAYGNFLTDGYPPFSLS